MAQRPRKSSRKTTKRDPVVEAERRRWYRVLLPIIRPPCKCKLKPIRPQQHDEDHPDLCYEWCEHILAAERAFDDGKARFTGTLQELAELLLFVDPLLKENNRHAERRLALPSLATLERESRIQLYMTRHAAGLAIFHPGDLTQAQADQFSVQAAKGRRELGLIRHGPTSSPRAA